MARWGNVDFRQLQALQRKMQQLERVDATDLCIDVSYELAKRLLAKVKRRTPVGVYGTKTVEFNAKLKAKNVHFFTKGGREVSFATRERTKHVKFVANSGLTGGTLRRNWDVTTVKRQGYSYKIDVFNDTEYAIYVEFGHRTANHKGWVPGKFMLTISEKEIQDLAPKLVQRKLETKLREVFDT